MSKDASTSNSISPDSLPLGIYRSTPEGRLLAVNARMVEIFGYDSKEEMLSISAYDLYRDPSRRDEIAGNISSRDKTDSTCELEMKRKDGTLIAILSRIGIVRNKNGEILYFNGILEDITEQKKAERELARSLEYERIIASISTRFIHMPVERIDHELKDAIEKIGRLHDSDHAFIALIEDDKFTFERVYEFAAPGMKPHSESISNISLGEYPWGQSQIGRRRDICIPSVHDMPKEAEAEKELVLSLGVKSVVAIPMVYGDRLVGCVGLDSVRSERQWTQHEIKLLKLTSDIFTNAIMRKQAEESIVYQANLLQIVSEAIIATDRDLRVKSWNRSAERMYGWKLDEAVGRHLAELLDSDFCGTDLETARAELLRNKSWQGEVVQRTKDGRRLYVMASVSLVVDEEGQHVGGVTVHRDVTDQKIAEQKLKAAYDALEAERKLLENKNIALKEVLIHIEEEKKAAREQVARTVESVLLPALHRIADDDGGVRQTCLDILKSGLSELASSQGGLTDMYSKLSPREVEVCSLIRSGATSQEIANRLFISHATVKKHRERIRTKLNLRKQGINLQTYLKNSSGDV